MKFQHSKSMSSVSRWLRTQQKWGDSFYELTGIFRKNSSFRFSQKWPIWHLRIWIFSTQNQFIVCHDDSGPPKKWGDSFYESTGIFRKNSIFRFSQKWPIRTSTIWNFSTQNQCLVCHDDSGPIKNGGTHFMNKLKFFEKIRFFVFLKNDQKGPPRYKISALKINV